MLASAVKARMGAALPSRSARIEFDVLQFEPAGLDLRQVEDVVEDGQQGLARLAHHLQAVALHGGEFVRRHGLGHAQHAVQGCADLVAHGGQEGALGPIGGLGGEAAFLGRRPGLLQGFTGAGELLARGVEEVRQQRQRDHRRHHRPGVAPPDRLGRERTRPAGHGQQIGRRRTQEHLRAGVVLQQDIEERDAHLDHGEDPRDRIAGGPQRGHEAGIEHGGGHAEAHHGQGHAFPNGRLHPAGNQPRQPRLRRGRSRVTAAHQAAQTQSGRTEAAATAMAAAVPMRIGTLRLEALKRRTAASNSERLCSVPAPEPFSWLIPAVSPPCAGTLEVNVYHSVSGRRGCVSVV